jgi:hypothetical protein
MAVSMISSKQRYDDSDSDDEMTKDQDQDHDNRYDGEDSLGNHLKKNKIIRLDDRKNKVVDTKINDDNTIEQLCKQMGEIIFDDKVFVPPPIYTGTLEGLTLKELCEKLKTTHDRWYGPEAKKLKNFYAVAHYVFGLDMLKGDYVEEMIDKIYSRLHLELIQLNLAFSLTGVIDSDSSIGMDYQRKFYRMHETLYNAHNMLCFSMRGENTRDSKKCNAAPEKYDLFRFQSFNPSDLNSLETLHLFIETRAAEKNYKKMGEIFFKEHYVRRREDEDEDEEDDDGEDGENHDNNKKKEKERKRREKEKREKKESKEEEIESEEDEEEERMVDYGTYSYDKVCSIKQFILRECDPATNFTMWRAMMDKNNLERVVKIISENPENQRIPDLRRDRTITAWRNGLWFAEYAAFYPYSRGRLPGEVVANQFIDQEFDNTDYGDDFMKIPCIVKKILGDQNYDELEQSCILGVGLGRLIFEPGKYDRWEILPFLWGLAGTGKSCIIGACSKLFSPGDVHGVGASFEGKFGLQDWYDKMLVVIQDITKNFPMDPADVKTITSLELMSVAIKFENAVCIKWCVSVIIGGNVIPTLWKDALGALKRRIFMIDFPNHVTRDNRVAVQLESEHSLFYRIITYAYHFWQRKCGTKNIWDYVPQRFLDSSNIISEHENPMEMFLNSTEIEITKNPGDYMSEGLIRTVLKNWCNNWGHRISVQPSELRGAMKNRGVKIQYCEKEWPLNQTPAVSQTPASIASSSSSSSSTTTTLLAPVVKKATQTDHFYFGIKLVPKRSANAIGIVNGVRTGGGGTFGSSYKR